MIQIKMPVAFQEILQPARYKGFWGGRGSGKSWSLAEAAGIVGYQEKIRFLCVREFQNSITDSVHRLIADRIFASGLGLWYEINQTSIRGDNGTEFLFKGIRQSPQEVKSMEGIDICWYEEAQRASKESLDLLIPTIRQGITYKGVENGSRDPELWFGWNPEKADNPIEKLLRGPNPPRNSIVRKVNWQDNPYFPKVLDDERRYLLEQDPVAYEHVWEGGYQTITEAVIFGRRVEFRSFDTPPTARFFFGADFGFAKDPATLIRSWIDESSRTLYIDQEAWGYGVEIDELPQLYDSVPESRKWPIKGDNSRPETISALKRQGFNITPADKWPGCVEDGIGHLKSFSKIVIHDRCPRMAQEARLYSYKVDKTTGDVLPIIVDAHNHGWDAVRYSLDKYIQRRGSVALFSKLAQ